MTAQQFQLRYSAIDDRILIAVTDAHGTESVFALTRRLVGRLVPGLRGILGELPEPAPLDAPPADAHDDTSEPAAAPDATPSGTHTAATTAPAPPQAAEAAAPAVPPAPEPGRLVTRMRIASRKDGMHILQVSDAQSTLNMPLNETQLTQFTSGLMTMLEHADWNLDLTPAVPEKAAEDGAPQIDITADSPSRYRH
jgi:hypothetical protein